VNAGCDVLFIPGGGSAPTRVPWITMCRNLLPHDPPERRRYGWSWMFLRLLLLRFSQMKSFRRADGVIFLTRYARAAVLPNDDVVRSTTVISHGIREAFRQPPREQKPLSAFSFERPFRWLYVSIVDVYKHQWEVAEAIGALHAQGLPVALDFVGPAFPPALNRLRKVLHRIDPVGEFIRYRGVIAYSELPGCYREADGFVFASSCETFGQILVEAMASGLPIACSNRSAMPEILGDAGLYFDPEKPLTIAKVLRELMEQPALRAHLARSAYEAAKSYSWEKCASQTFAYLREVAQSRERRPCVASLE
jgi:glycosyltransferase involved in cell wall biosynthesis